MRISTLALYASLGLSLVSACRSSGDDGNTTDGPPGNGDGPNNGDGGGSGQTIYQIQSNSVANMAPVSISGVIVTAIDTNSSQKGNFWVEEPAGGPFSGVLVHNAQLTDVAALTVGDIVTITGGIKSEFALSSDTSGNTDTEIEPATGGKLTVTKTGTGTVPTPAPVDALMFGQAATQAACDAMPTTCATNVDWRMYEGVLIQVTSTGGGVIAGAPSTGSDATKLHFNLTGQIDVESTLVDFPTSPKITSGECLASVTGVLDYFFQYNLLPRTTADIATGGTGCPAREESAGTTIGTCGDTMDNDGNGFVDCQDLGCEVGSGAWVDPSNCTTGATTCGCSTNTTAGTGVATANGETASTPLIVHSVVVTAVSSSGFWIADAAAAASGHGIFVFTSTTPTVTVGENVTSVQGLAGPFGQGSGSGALKVEEFSDSTVVAGAGSATLVPLSGQTAATLTNLANGGAFAGVLVTLTNVKTTALADTHNQVKVVDNAGTAFTMDDEAFFGYGTGSSQAATPVIGTCFKTLTGVMDLQTSDQIRTINPRGSGDMVATGGTCN